MAAMRLFLMLSTIFLVSCSTSHEGDLNFITSEPSKIEAKGKSANLEHTRYFPLASLSTKSRNTEFLERIDFIPLYVGHERGLVKIYPEGDYHTMYYPDWYHGPEAPNVDVFVDTTQTLSKVYRKAFDKSTD